MGFNLTTHENLSPDDFILVLKPGELNDMRTALRNESERLKRQGFDGLRAHIDQLRDKISNAMIDQAQSRIDNSTRV